MLIITEATINAFASFLAEREYSPATINKYAHNLRLLMDYAPEGTADKAALVGFRAYLTGRGYAPTSVNSILGAASRAAACSSPGRASRSTARTSGRCSKSWRRRRR